MDSPMWSRRRPESLSITADAWNGPSMTASRRFSRWGTPVGGCRDDMGWDGLRVGTVVRLASGMVAWLYSYKARVTSRNACRNRYRGDPRPKGGSRAPRL